MEQVFMRLFDILDELLSESEQQQIYEEIIPKMMDYDEELVENLSEEDPTFAAAAQQIYPD
mgnify:CR=1 FL=1|jgi:hypothetical protein|tara:strand:+ start:1318 stop:1500 length:183 start_codon:yes stop_codon:yes gene_type:complete